MKHKFVTILLAISLFSSCKSKIDEEVPPFIDFMDGKVTILKLSKPEYKPYIIANYANGADYFISYYANLYGKPVGKSSFSPYWDLIDDWLLVDWKWSTDFPCLEGAVLLSNEPWERLNFVNQTWPLETPHVSEPVVSVYTINAVSVATACGKYYDEDFLYNIFKVSSYCDNPSVKPYENIEELDSVWSILQADISTVIKSGNWDWIAQPHEIHLY